MRARLAPATPMTSTFKPPAAMFLPGILAAALLAAPARADVITDWNVIALKVLATANPSNNARLRTLAMMHVAMSDAINSVQARYARVVARIPAVAGASAEAAAAAAARHILVELYPNQKASIDEAYVATLKAIPDGSAKSDGIALGEQVAAGVEAECANDGTNAPDTYRPLTSPGVYVPTTLPVSAEYAQAKPWLLEKADHFRKLYPEVRVDLGVDERRLDLTRGAADVALRTGARPTESGLVVRRLTPMAWAAYCSRDYAERRGCPNSVDAFGRHAVIGAEGPIALLPGWTWLQEAAPEAEVVARSSSLTNLVSAVKAGLGITVLPCVLADSDADLVRCIGPISGVQSDLWLLTRQDARDVRRVRAFVDFLAAHVAAMRSLLAGEAGPGRARVLTIARQSH